MNFKKIALSFLVVIAFIGYALGLRHPDNHTVSLPTTANNSGAGTNSGSMPSTTASTNYKDGNYTGSVADAFYGNIQVAVTIQSGKITDVKFLQYPNDRQNSLLINQQAMPLLKQETIQAQSAHIDGVTGATDTSQAFVQSLASALSQAA